jgi:hypothetical protein
MNGSVTPAYGPPTNWAPRSVTPWDGSNPVMAPNGIPVQFAGSMQQSMGPTFIEVIMKGIISRWPMLIGVILLAGGISFFLMQNFGKEYYQVVGRMIYRNSEDSRMRQLFSPPNMDTVVQIVKSKKSVEKVRADIDPNFPIDQPQVQKEGFSEIITLKYESPNAEKSVKVIDLIMDLARADYKEKRNEAIREGVKREMEEQKRLLGEQADKTKTLRTQLASMKVMQDPKQELDAISKDISTLTSEYEKNQGKKSVYDQQEKQLKADILEAEQKAGKSGVSSRTDLILEEGKLKQAKLKLQTSQNKLVGERELFRKGITSRNELIELEDIVKSNELEVSTLEANIKSLKANPPVNMLGGDPGALAESLLRKLNLDRKEVDEALKINLKQIDEKVVKRDDLMKAIEKVGPLMQEIDRLDKGIQEQGRRLSELKSFESLLNSDRLELQIESPAKCSEDPVRSNYWKIALGILGISLMGFVGLVALLDLPKYGSEARQSLPPVGMSGALAPYGNPQAPYPSLIYPQANLVHSNGIPQPIPEASGHSSVQILGRFSDRDPRYASGLPGGDKEELHQVANEIARGAREPGSIVLFSPMGEGTKIENLVTELSRHHTSQGESVLIFDARGLSSRATTLQTKADSNPDLNVYFEGSSSDASGFFAKTDIPSVEYTRADVSQHVAGGPMGMMRFQRLLEEMRHRYSRIFMITPPMKDLDDLSFLTAISEGVVLILQDQANPNDVENYVQAFRSAKASIFGAVVVSNTPGS